MGNEFVTCIFLLLLFLTLDPGVASNVLRLPSMNLVEQIEDDGHSSSHFHVDIVSLANYDPTFTVMKDIQVGKTIPVSFPYIKDLSPYQFLSREKTHHIPFSSKAISELHRFFSVFPGSKQAMEIEQTLKFCERDPPAGEATACLTSFESLTDYARGIIGSDSDIRIVRSSLISSSTPTLQNYTIMESKERLTGKVIPCHAEPYPYAVYYCHFQVNTDNKLFMVSLRGENGDWVDAVFLCHMDSSPWSVKSKALIRLGLKPGESEVCHFFPAYDLVVVPQ
ncbi:hypothetical protein F3Y22_tig00111025pilonHSYRG00057 [Hibiscus syriacus]|uniref:BURP domain-containing protein n=1 Tax=Hibiscus syriacus TaxID=106335 RepID=A0A6A2Z659_HIBSY|nr:BURP domain-containing protein 3-like [Hibiscus syriacus]KAE8687053.1 hypothetical protein F3Y22_tig00111025pilonHSYRG00057 [Hibiscus syriacus]